MVDRRRGTKGTVPRWTFYAVAGWAVVVWLSGIDIQAGDRLYPSVLVYDFNLRTALVEGISRHGLPAISPLFFPGHFVLLRYLLLWFMATAPGPHAGRTAGGSKTGAGIAGDVWCGWALMAVVVLCLRFFHPAGERGIGNRAKWGVGMLAVAGLDIFPNIFPRRCQSPQPGLWFSVFSSAEWWNRAALRSRVSRTRYFFRAASCRLTDRMLHGLPSDVAITERRPCSLAVGRLRGVVTSRRQVGLSVYVSFTFTIFLTGLDGVHSASGKKAGSGRLVRERRDGDRGCCSVPWRASEGGRLGRTRSRLPLSAASHPST